MLKKIDGLMTNSGFKKLQSNSVDLYLARIGNDHDLVKILTAERKAICDDNTNYVYEEVPESQYVNGVNMHRELIDY